MARRYSQHAAILWRELVSMVHPRRAVPCPAPTGCCDSRSSRPDPVPPLAADHAAAIARRILRRAGYVPLVFAVGCCLTGRPDAASAAEGRQSGVAVAATARVVILSQPVSIRAGSLDQGLAGSSGRAARIELAVPVAPTCRDPRPAAATNGGCRLIVYDLP